MLLARRLWMAGRTACLGGVLVVGCGGADGDPCQQESDCDDGLVCCSATGATVMNGARGTCLAMCTVTRTDASIDSGAPDAATSEDASVDATVDSATDAALDGQVLDADVEAGADGGETGDGGDSGSSDAGDAASDAD